jgi:hypothetical protein
MLGQYLRSSRQLRLEGTATLVHQCKPVAGADTMADAVNGVFEDTADGIVALSSISIAAAKEMELSFKWSAAAGSTATPVHQCKPAAGADTTAEAVKRGI